MKQKTAHPKKYPNRTAKKIDKKTLFLFYFSVSIMILSTFIAVWNYNLEFLFYTFILYILLLIIVLYYRKLHLDRGIFFGLAALAFFHLLGGHLFIAGTRLYEIYLIPQFFRYDNFVHTFGVFVATFAVYSLLHPHLDKKIEHNRFLLSVVIILISLGLGSLNEVFELGAALFLNASAEVGDYYNNAFDLVFNFVGAVSASAIIMQDHKKHT